MVAHGVQPAHPPPRRPRTFASRSRQVQWWPRPAAPASPKRIPIQSPGLAALAAARVATLISALCVRWCTGAATRRSSLPSQLLCAMSRFHAEGCASVSVDANVEALRPHWMVRESQTCRGAASISTSISAQCLRDRLSCQISHHIYVMSDHIYAVVWSEVCRRCIIYVISSHMYASTIRMASSQNVTYMSSRITYMMPPYAWHRPDIYVIAHYIYALPLHI